MPVNSQEARGQIVDVLDGSIERLALAVDLLGEAFEGIDTSAQDRLEEGIFRSVQRSLGQAKRARSGFAARHGLSAQPLDAGQPNRLPRQPRDTISAAAEAAGIANHELTELQDSMLPAEYGDPELRAAIAEVRTLLEAVPSQTRELLRTLGR